MIFCTPLSHEWAEDFRTTQPFGKCSLHRSSPAKGRHQLGAICWSSQSAGSVRPWTWRFLRRMFSDSDRFLGNSLRDKWALEYCRRSQRSAQGIAHGHPARSGLLPFYGECKVGVEFSLRQKCLWQCGWPAFQGHSGSCQHLSRLKALQALSSHFSKFFRELKLFFSRESDARILFLESFKNQSGGHSDYFSDLEFVRCPQISAHFGLSSFIKWNARHLQRSVGLLGLTPLMILNLIGAYYFKAINYY